EEAEKVLDGLLARNPHFAPALLVRGKMASQAGDYARAETWLREATALLPGDYQAHFQLQQVLVRHGQDDEARDVDRRMKQIEDDLKRLQDILFVLMQQNPRDALLHYEVGMIMLRGGSVEEAAKWMESTLRIDPTHKGAHKALSEYYQHLGQTGLAAQHRTLAGPDGPASSSAPPATA